MHRPGRFVAVAGVEPGGSHKSRTRRRRADASDHRGPVGACGAAPGRCSRAGVRTQPGVARGAPRVAEPRRSQRRPLRPGGAGWRAGVGCRRCRGARRGRRPRASGGYPRGDLGAGAFAERSAVEVGALAEVPPSVDLAEAAASPVAGVAALRALRAAGAVLGKRVLITGASGGVGRFAVQLAAHAGAHVIASVGSVARGEGLAKAGADEVVVGLDGVDQPVDVVLDNVGGPQLVAAWEQARGGGRLARRVGAGGRGSAGTARAAGERQGGTGCAARCRITAASQITPSVANRPPNRPGCVPQDG